MSDDNAILDTVLAKTAATIEGVQPDQRTAGTPCPDWDVQRLLAHLVGWSGNFASRAEGDEPDPEPDAIDPGDSPGVLFRQNADRILAGLAQPSVPEGAPDRDILIAEFILHGWDLATATGQPIPYLDAEAAPALVAMQGMLKPEYRGMGFEAEVTVPDDTGELDQLIAFSGRDPHAS